MTAWETTVQTPRDLMTAEQEAGRGKRMPALGPRDCRFPTGRPVAPGGRIRRFCGQPTQAGSPYCEAHHAIAYQPRPTEGDKPADTNGPETRRVWR